MDGLVATLMIIGGLWTFFSPKGAFNFKSKLVKNWGVTMSATPKAYKTMKIIGLAVAMVGFLLYFS